MYSYMSLCCPFVYWKWNNPDVLFISLGCLLCARSGTVLMYSLCTRCGTVLMYSMCSRCGTVSMYSLLHWAALWVPEVGQSWCSLCVIGLSFVYQKLNTVQVAQVCRVFTMSCQFCSTVCVWTASTAQEHCKQHVRSFWRQNFKAACWKFSAPSVPPMLGSVVLSCRNLDILSTSSHQMIP